MRNVYLLFSFIILTCLSISLNNCNFLNKEQTKDYNSFRTQKIEYRDSLFIIYTIRKWHNCDCLKGFEDYSRMYKMSNNQIQYFLGGTFYSPDKKKIIVWVGEKIPNAYTKVIYNSEDSNVNKLCGECDSIKVYGVRSIVGYRKNSDTCWNLYPLDIYSVDCCNTKEKSIRYTEQFYFKEMKTADEWYVKTKYLDNNYGGKVRYDLEEYANKMGAGNSDTNDIYKDFGYNLQDKEFWDKSLIWQKGARVPGYYCFQLNGNGGTAIDPLEMPKINYPDNILELYK